jgi:uncharacterized protein YndB with AHSA1/START domain
MATNFDWSRFTVRINVAAPEPSLYNAWATKDGMESWFLRLCDYQRPGAGALDEEEKVKAGDSYTWRWFGYPDDVVEHGSIIEANGSDTLRFTFGKAGICTMRIYNENDARILELEQEDIPADEHGRMYYHVDCKTGWTFYLANLKSLYEGGIDLRNRNEALKNMCNA